MKATLSHTEKRIVVKKNGFNGIDSYDLDNNYPQRVRDIADNSGMATTCIKLYHSFLYGKGFQNVEFAKAKINRHRLTPDKLLLLNSENYSYNGGFAVHVNYNALYEKSEVNFHPFQTIRFTNQDSKQYGKYAVYKDWGERNIDANKVNYINKYNPDPNIISNEVDAAGGFNYYKGQIYYVSNRLLQYAKAVYDAVLEDMQSDSKTKGFKYRAITNNFHASHILKTTKGESPDGDKDIIESGGRRRRDREQNAMVDSLEKFQGNDDAMNIMHVELETPDQLFDLVKVDQQQADGLYQYTESSVRDNIRQSFLIPSILLMQQPGRLGATQEFIDATNYYNLITESERLLFEEVYREVFSNFKDKINKEEDYFIIPKSSIKKNDSQRNQQIMDILKDVSLSPEQKREILVLMHEVPEEDAEKLTKFKLNDTANNSQSDSAV